MATDLLGAAKAATPDTPKKSFWKRLTGGEGGEAASEKPEEGKKTETLADALKAKGDDNADDKKPDAKEIGEALKALSKPDPGAKPNPLAAGIPAGLSLDQAKQLINPAAGLAAGAATLPHLTQTAAHPLTPQQLQALHANPTLQNQQALAAQAALQQALLAQAISPLAEIKNEFGANSLLEIIQSLEAQPVQVDEKDLVTNFPDNVLVADASVDDKNKESAKRDVYYLPVPKGPNDTYTVQVPAGAQIAIKRAYVNGSPTNGDEISKKAMQKVVAVIISVPTATGEHKQNKLLLPVEYLDKYTFSYQGKEGPSGKKIYEAARKEALQKGVALVDPLIDRVNKDAKADSAQIREELVVGHAQLKKKNEDNLNPVLLNDGINPELSNHSPVYLHLVKPSKEEIDAAVKRMHTDGEYTASAKKCIESDYALVGLKDQEETEVYSTYAVKNPFTVNIGGSHYKIESPAVLPVRLVDQLINKKADDTNFTIESEGSFSLDNNFVPTRTLLIRPKSNPLKKDAKGEMIKEHPTSSITVLEDQKVLVVGTDRQGKAIKTAGRDYLTYDITASKQPRPSLGSEISAEEQKGFLELIRRAAVKTKAGGAPGEPYTGTGSSVAVAGGEETNITGASGSGAVWYNPLTWSGSKK